MGRPNVLVVLSDRLRHPPVHESQDLQRFRRERIPGRDSLRKTGVSFKHHHPMTAVCVPSRASLLTEACDDV
jgi:arylsulfatase A-like enzyme